MFYNGMRIFRYVCTQVSEIIFDFFSGHFFTRRKPSKNLIYKLGNMPVRFFLVAMYLFVSMTSLSSQPKMPSGWSRKVIPDCRCTSIMPESATKREMETQTEVGKLTFVSWTSTDSTDRSGQIYFLSWVDYPAETFHPDSTEVLISFLNETLDSHRQQVNGKLVYTSQQTFAGHPGLLFRLNLPEKNNFVKGRMIVKGNRFYLWQVFAPEKKYVARKMDAFLDQLEFSQ